MSQKTLPRCRAWILASTLTTLAACGDQAAWKLDPTETSGGATNLSVSFASSGALATNASGSAIIVGADDDTLVINSVQIVLNDVELRREEVSTCPDAMPARTNGERSADDMGCSRLDLGPMLLDVPLDGVSSSQLSAAIPAASYREVAFAIKRVRTESSATAAERLFVTQHPEFGDQTVRVTGTYRGEPFTFTSVVEADVEFEFDPALAVEAGVNDNVTVSLDLSRWFRSETGALLAPTTDNQALIDQNIATSFDAFGDRDLDGREDRGRGRGRRMPNQP